MSTSKKGQASLEMVVGLIILLVVAGVVIGLVMTTMNSNNISGVTGGNAGKFLANCKVYCEGKQYQSYCTATMKDITTSTDWNGDGTLGGLYKDEKVSVWDFCEDRVYCFLVYKCDQMTMENCRTYMCQQYVDKYTDTDSAVVKMKEVFKMSDNPAKCCRKDKNTNNDVCVSSLASKDNWLESGFASKAWCSAGGGSGSSNLDNCGDGVCDCASGEDGNTCPKSKGGDCVATSCQFTCGNNVCEKVLGENINNCPGDCGGTIPPATVTLGNCTYNSSADDITCDTNCLGTVSGKTTPVLVADKNQNTSMAMDGSAPIGTISIAGGKVNAKPADSIMGVKLSSLDQTTTAWMIALSCNNPVGNGKTLSGAVKI